jgi:hypothetical protein
MIQLARTYFMNGPAPKGTRHPFGLQDPPTSGYGLVLILRGEKRSTLLCPFTLRSYPLANHFAEVAGSVPVEATSERLIDVLTQSWADSTAMGLQRDYAVAALALTELGGPVPKTAVTSLADGEAPKVQGGKPVVHEALRVVNPESKRGAVARFFSAPAPQSLHEAMARLELTRSGVLSHLHCLNRDHGVGYTLAGDCATLVVPEGFDLFAYVQPERKVATAPVDDEGNPREVKKRTSGKAVNPEALSPIPEPGKRAVVARHFLDWKDVKLVETALELSRSAVLSHLFTINKENGLGYELSEDGTQARLLVPEGHDVFCAKQPRAKKEAPATEDLSFLE